MKQGAIMRREIVENRLTASLDSHRASAEKAIALQTQKELTDWHRKHPRRALRFMDAMGSVCLWIDDRELNEFNDRRDPRLVPPVAPLQSLVKWYCKVSHEHGVCIDDIDIGPTK